MHQTLTKQLGYLAIGATLALALTIGFATLAYADSATSTGTTTTTYVFDADLSGANQVPPVSATTSTSTNGMGTTTATTTGHAKIWFDMTNASGSSATTTNMWKSVWVWNGDDITAAHLHCGLPGQSGPVVLDLVHITGSTDVNGVLVATSSADQSDLHATTTGCSMPINNFTDLGNALKAGIIYANVHSVQYPSGVVRGQMILTSQSSTSTNMGNCPSDMSNGNGWYDANHIWHSCAGNSGNGGHSCNSTATSTNGWSGWYDSNGLWHSCGNTGGNGGNSCANMATSTNANGWSGWYDNTGTWHSCAGNGGNGGNNCVGAASTSLGWYDASGNWHSCNGNGTGGSGNCTASSTTGWWDSNHIWHSCGTGGTNGDGHCVNGQGWYDSNGMWHWCKPTGNGGGTTTPPVMNGSLGSSITSFVQSILHGSLDPADINKQVQDLVRGVRTLR